MPIYISKSRNKYFEEAADVVVQGVKYLPAFAEGLRIDSIVGFDLYLKSGRGNFVLYRNRDLPFTRESAERLKSVEAGQLYIDAGDREEYFNYIEQHLPEILADKSISLEKKSTLLYDSASNAVSQIFRTPDAPENLLRSENVVNYISGFVIGDREAFKKLFSIASHDYYTYTHSINVCTYSLALADTLTITDPQLLRDLGVGALLHDIGKARISDKIIAKPGTLDASEWEEIKRHPEYGRDILVPDNIVGPASMDVVLGHHEKLDGSGYPLGLGGKEISLNSRIACIADVFDALTTVRPYKGAKSTYDALMLMSKEMRKHLDRELYENFIRMLQE